MAANLFIYYEQTINQVMADNKKEKISAEENAREEAKNLVYQEENIERDDEQFSAEEVCDKKVEAVNEKLSPDENSMDSRG